MGSSSSACFTFQIYDGYSRLRAAGRPVPSGKVSHAAALDQHTAGTVENTAECEGVDDSQGPGLGLVGVGDHTDCMGYMV